MPWWYWSTNLNDNDVLMKPYTSNWDQKQYRSGLKGRIEDKLPVSKRWIWNLGAETLGYSQEAWLLADACLEASAAFLGLLSRYIDDRYNQLLVTGFPPDRSWHLVSQLVHRIFCDMNKVRVGLEGVQSLSNKLDNAAAVMLAVMCTHEYCWREESRRSPWDSYQHDKARVWVPPGIREWDGQCGHWPNAHNDAKPLTKWSPRGTPELDAREGSQRERLRGNQYKHRRKWTRRAWDYSPWIRPTRHGHGDEKREHEEQYKTVQRVE